MVRWRGWTAASRNRFPPPMSARAGWTSKDSEDAKKLLDELRAEAMLMAELEMGATTPGAAAPPFSEAGAPAAVTT